MDNAQRKCDECGVTLDYYTKSWFLWGKSTEDVLNKMENCITYCNTAYNELAEFQPGIAANYYTRLSDIKDLKNKYISDIKPSVKHKAKPKSPKSLLRIN